MLSAHAFTDLSSRVRAKLPADVATRAMELWDALHAELTCSNQSDLVATTGVRRAREAMLLALDRDASPEHAVGFARFVALGNALQKPDNGAIPVRRRAPGPFLIFGDLP